MPNYTNSKIYKLISDRDPEFLYIGSTTQPLAKRLGSHKSNARSGKTSKRCQKIRDLEYDIRIILLEKYPCKDKEELRAREEFLIHTFGKEKLTNTYSATQTEEERKEYNRKWVKTEKGKEIRKRYQQSQKGVEYRREWARKKYWFNKACLELGKLTNLF